MKPVHGILLLALLFNAVANILIKEGMRAKALDLADPVGVMKAIALNPVLIAGVICFATALGAYSIVLNQVRLSVAYPIMTSGGFLIVACYSFLKLHESIAPLQIAGMLLILAGVWMVSMHMAP